MFEFFSGLDPILMALLASLFTWGLTALGAAPVFFTAKHNQKVMDGALGIAAGVMIAASYWSLLAPAIEMSDGDFKPALFGFLAGGGTLYLIDKILPHLHIGLDTASAEGIHTGWKRSVLLVLAITLHNIPEGLAVGVAFGALSGVDPASHLYVDRLGAAVALALGIGLQNLPEGLAVSMPLRREGLGRLKSFLAGQASGAVEPVAAVLGAFAVMTLTSMLPYALAFAAGAMLFVVVEELIPESQRNGYSDFATVGALLGFALMMSLDVALG